MGRGAATTEKSPGAAPTLRGRRQPGDLGETWQVINRKTGDILAECPTDDLAWEFVDGHPDAEALDVPDPIPA